MEQEGKEMVAMPVRRDQSAKKKGVWESTEVRPISPVPIALLSLLIVMIVWTWVLLFGEETMRTFMTMSAKFRMVNLRSTPVVYVLILFSVLAVSLWSYLLVNRKRLFFVLLVCSFVFSEVLLRGLNEIAFGIRYVSITVLVSLGITQFIRRFKEGLDVVQRIGLAYLAWSFINLCINGFDSTSLAMIPMQLAIVLGFLFGFKSVYGDHESAKFMCIALGVLGAALTLFNLSSFALVSKPILYGRFRSAFLLPTTFADAYVLLFISMLWLTIREAVLFRKVLLGSLVVIGLVLLFLSGTRNSMLMFVVAMSALAIIWRAKAPVILVLMAGVLVLGVIALTHESETIGYLSERLTKFSTRNRIEVWKLSWEYIKARPLIGYGFGKELQTLAKSMPGWSLVNPHNAYLGLWLQTGLFGLALMLAIYFISMLRGVRILMSKAIDRDLRRVFALPVVLLISLFVGGFFEENLSSRGSLYQVIWGLSVFTVCTEYTSKQRT